MRQPEALLARQSVVILDRDGGELYRFFQEEDRTAVRLDSVPQHLVDAVVAIEDKRFFTRHICIDIRALGRAALANAFDLKSQGASTITQQLIRTAFLTRDKTVERKIREIMLACQLEMQRSKEDIIGLYLNWIHFGHGVAGVQQAAKLYFGKDVADLTIAESAVIAALPQRPTYFSPYGSHRFTTLSGAFLSADSTNVIIGLIGTEVQTSSGTVALPGRADVVLQAMHENGSIDDAEFSKAKRELANLTFRPRLQAIRAPHFVLAVRERGQQMMEENGWDERDGLRIETTIDPALQELAETIVATHQERVQERDAHDIALVAVDPRTNEVVAYVGSPDFFREERGQIDMARRVRPPGSSFKPFVYAALLEDGYKPESYIYDSPLSTSIYRPHNYSRGYYGRMTVRTALARSRNVPAINAFYLIGEEERLLPLADQFGVSSPLAYKKAQLQENPDFTFSWPLALGTGESSLIEMVEGYSVFASAGWHRDLMAIRSIKNRDGQTLYEPVREATQIVSAATAEMLTDILSDENAREPLWRFGLMNVPGKRAAVKTGTSNVCLERDALGVCMKVLANNTWTLGYTDELVVGVWVGNADNKPMIENTSAFDLALPIWREFMRAAQPNT